MLKNIRVLVPGTGTRFRCGGLSVALQTSRLLQSLRPTEVVTYRVREPSLPYLDDLLRSDTAPGQSLWLVSWGFDVPGLLKRLMHRKVAYQAHSTGYGFNLPPAVPVIAVSRNTLGYWGDKAPRNPLFLVPNALESQWQERGDRSAASESRPFGVLVQERKSSAYVLKQLVPALRSKGLKVKVQKGWVDDLVEMFNSATVYIYDTAEYWRGQGVSEGFGLPPIEALSCGCIVFSSFNHALADTLTLGETAYQIGQGSLLNDVERISLAVSFPLNWRPDPETLERLLFDLSETNFCNRWRNVLENLDHQEKLGVFGFDNVHSLRSASTAMLRWNSRFQKMKSLPAKVADRLPGWLTG